MALDYIGRSIINKCFINLDELSSSNRILDLCEFPKNYVAFTLYDPVFEFLYSSDASIKSQAKQDLETKKKAREVFSYEENALLAPLYQHPKARDLYGYKYGCSSLSFMVEDITFTVREPGNGKSFAIFGRKISSDKLHLAVKVKRKTSEIDKAFYQWMDWLKITQKISLDDFLLESQDKIFHLKFNLYEIQPDYIASLLLILHESRRDAAIAAVSWTSDESIPLFFS